jgi:hypothetical protein
MAEAGSAASQLEALTALNARISRNLQTSRAEATADQQFGRHITEGTQRMLERNSSSNGSKTILAPRRKFLGIF